MELGRRQVLFHVVGCEGSRLDPDPTGRVLAQGQPLGAAPVLRESGWSPALRGWGGSWVSPAPGPSRRRSARRRCCGWRSPWAPGSRSE